MMAATQTLGSRSNRKARVLPALFTAFLGLVVITLTGHVQAAAMHDAAHDVRHANGFPCH